MKMIFGFLMVLGLSMSVQAESPRKPASIPESVRTIAAKLKRDVRTVIKATYTALEDANPCNAAGDGYMIQVQVKKQVHTMDPTKTKYTWETVREVSVDKDGGEMEICQE